MSKQRNLFLEERIVITRRALNEQTMQFQDLLPENEQERFKYFVRAMMDVLEGWGTQEGVDAALAFCPEPK